MKKLITSFICLMTLLSTFSFSMTAQQTKLSESEKEMLKKEVLPLIFDQIKQQTGMDFLKWGQPQKNPNYIINSLFGTKQSQLRSSSSPISIRPDSANIYLGNISGMNSTIVNFVGDINILPVGGIK